MKAVAWDLAREPHELFAEDRVAGVRRVMNVDRVRHRSARREMLDTSFQLSRATDVETTQRDLTFVLDDFHKDPGGYARKLEGALNGN